MKQKTTHLLSYLRGGEILKKIIIMLVISSMITGSVFGANNISVIVDEKILDFDVKPQVINDRTMVPVRAIFEALGATVDWDEKTETVYSTKGDTKVSIQINNKKMLVNDLEKIIDVPARVIGGRTLVPVRAISEAFGCKVDWNEKTNTVIINSPGDKGDISEEKEDSANRREEQKDEELGELKCVTSVSKTMMSIGDRYRIMFSVIVNGKGGGGFYRYRYELYQDGGLIDDCIYSEENRFEGTVIGYGECVLRVFVLDDNGYEVSNEIILSE